MSIPTGTRIKNADARSDQHRLRLNSKRPEVHLSRIPLSFSPDY